MTTHQNFHIEKVLCYALVFTEAAGGVLLAPVVSLYARSLGASVIGVSILFTILSISLFFSSTLLGILSDKNGRRTALFISAAAGAVAWFVIALSDSLLGLYIGSALLGVAASNVVIIQSFLSDQAKTRYERTLAFGIIGMFIGLAAIAAPLFTSALYEAHDIFWGLAIAFATLALGIALLFKNHPSQAIPAPLAQPKKLFSFLHIDTNQRTLIPAYLAWFVIGIAMSGTNAIFSLYLKDVLHLSTTAILYLFTGAGVLVTLSQGPALSLIWLRFFKEETLVIRTPLIIAVSFLAMAVPVLGLFLIGYAVEQIIRPIFRVTVTSHIAETTTAHHSGSILGSLGSVNAFAMMVGPLIFGALYTISPASTFIASAICGVVTFICLHQLIKSTSVKLPRLK